MGKKQQPYMKTNKNNCTGLDEHSELSLGLKFVHGKLQKLPQPLQHLQSQIVEWIDCLLVGEKREIRSAK